MTDPDSRLAPGPGTNQVIRRAEPAIRAAARLYQAPWRAIDVAATTAGVLAAHRFSPSYAADPAATRAWSVALVHALTTFAAAHAVGLYESQVIRSRVLLWRRALVAASLAVVGTLAFFYTVRYAPIGRWIAGMTWLGTVLALGLPRRLLARVWGIPERCVLFVGDGPLARATIETLDRLRPSEFRFVRLDGPASGGDAGSSLRSDILRGFCERERVDDLVLPSRGESLSPFLVPAMGCLELGCRLSTDADFYEETLGRVPIQHIHPDWLLNRGWDTSDPWTEAAKRASDVALALAAAPLTLPLAALAALAIHLDDGGPVLFAQTRVGRFGRPFRMWKLRTMRAGSEAGSSRWTMGSDPRLTRVGRWLRKTRIDELPQLLHVLRGQMSFVGPRPEQLEIARELEQRIPYYAWRHQVRPGLTGWAQLAQPYASSVEEAGSKLELDLYYIRHRSWSLDAAIVLRTLTTFARGAR